MSSEPRTTLHVVVFLGLAGVGIILLLMMTSMESLQQTQAGTRAKIANAVIGEYKAENVYVEFRENGAQMALHLNYRTREYLKPDARDRQMQDMARFIYQETLKYEDDELYKTLRIDVTRTELSGSGCFERKTEHKTSLDLPRRLPPAGRAGRSVSPPPVQPPDRPKGVPRDN
jgi:hypothetical protein